MSRTHAGELSEFELAGYRASSARLLRRETLDLATGPVTCQVIEVARDRDQGPVSYSPMTYWIDETRNLALKKTYNVTVQHADQPAPSESIVTVSFTKATVGSLVDQELFHFTPPADAVQVESLEFGPRSPLAGKEVPDFELKGADGNLINGASLRGNLLLLHFSPHMDDKMLVFAEMAHRSLAGKGLTTLYVLPSRRRPDTGSLSHTVPIAFDDGTLAKAFGVTSTGTVLIDRLGKVLFVDISYGDWLKLAHVLEKEGVW
jgi:hypothetical protein